ncbi:hypothetical protein VTP01DRAFT_10134, partial [Rhizomucor pusillus]|uniref:uncharacterized protein n=1 Tax=Rhizomucor pusillus TaxID=4840 RepID=UPI003744828D
MSSGNRGKPTLPTTRIPVSIYSSICTSEYDDIMGLMGKLKTQFDLWKLEKYTKRRQVATPDFEQKDREFYRQYYQDGVYLHQTQKTVAGEARIPPGKGVSRRSTFLGRKQEHIVRCSENYNYSR